MRPKHLLALFVLVMLQSAPAFAATTGLPWDTPWTTIRNSMTGPVAAGIGGIAIATGGLTYAFHGVIEEFIRKISGTVVAIGAAVGAATLLTALYAVRAATV
jgi:type IV secretory pathway VirB2 component (pilin)